MWKEKVDYEQRYTGDYRMNFPRGIGVQTCPAEEKLWDSLVEKANQSYQREGPRATRERRRYNSNRIVEEGNDVRIDGSGRILRGPKGHQEEDTPRPASKYTKARGAGASEGALEGNVSRRVLRSARQPVEVKKKKPWWQL